MLPREFWGLVWCVGANSGGLVVLGKKVTSEVGPGTQTIPACARGTQEQGQPELCSIFTRVPMCGGSDLQMQRGGSSVTLRPWECGVLPIGGSGVGAEASRNGHLGKRLRPAWLV